MSTSASKYPFFELSEIIPDNDLEIKAYKPLNPVRTGNFIPELNLRTEYRYWQQYYNGAQTHGPVSLRHLLDKPLVISFYSGHWNQLGLDQLKKLNAIHYEIKANGGNLLILKSERTNDLQNIAWEHSLSLNFYQDDNNEIAKKFRVYSDDNPAWNRFSGIDHNAPVLATYVIDPSGQVVYDHTDQELTRVFPAGDIISAVYDTSLQYNRKRSA